MLKDRLKTVAPWRCIVKYAWNCGWPNVQYFAQSVKGIRGSVKVIY